MREDCTLPQSGGVAAPWAWPNQTILTPNSPQVAQRLFTPNIGGVMGLGTYTSPNGSLLDTVIGQWLNRNPTNQTVSFGLA